MNHDVQACHDQNIAAMRDYAYICMEMIDWFQKFDFSREEALALLMQRLDHLTVYEHAST
jgi:hypothetical protein